jgi:hypothetical protein
MPPEAGRPTACENAPDPELWFPEYGDHDAEDAAKALCHLRTACLEFALVTRQEHGIWGAKNPAQRARILRTAQAAYQAARDGSIR